MTERIPPLLVSHSPQTLLSAVYTRVMSKAWLNDVASTPDVDLRAHRVALTYHHFARALDASIGDPTAVQACLEMKDQVPQRNANWFNFGMWATITINRDLGLRRDPLVGARYVPSGVRRRLTPTLLHLRAADGQRISRALSWGQRLVFLSTTYMLLEFLDPDRMDYAQEHTWSSRDEDVLFEILEQARWAGKEYLSPFRHLRVIKDAFKVYGRAKTYREARDTPRKKKDDEVIRFFDTMIARSILRANLMITAVEQDVVDEAVRQVIDQVPSLMTSAANARVARWGERYLGVPRQVTGLQLPYRTVDARERLQAIWARVMTERLLVLSLPTETLRLGRDIPPRRTSQPYFPWQLADLRSIPPLVTRAAKEAIGGDFLKAAEENGSLARLVDGFDRSRRNGRGSAAHDWRRYDERMGWAVNLLRSRQQDPSLGWSPYSLEDQIRIVEGHLPLRAGDPSEYEVQAPADGLPPRE
jgi:hypothetical protein